MPSGRQVGRENLAIFQTWLASKTEPEFRAMVNRGVLSRREIAKECGFGQSALSQNPDIKEALEAKEDELRHTGVLPPRAQKLPDAGGELPLRETGRQRASIDAERLSRLELDNAALRAENSELKRQLEKYALLDEALATTGRLLR
ncbi:VPA1267 family protein [Paraburkholderia sediminicola]|uniref:VPA1267 family protein n=1 Tax=Paraburkholderia rhynchosiae TaxID=487049 RepID=A0ACC7NFP7_9BURK